LLVDHFIGIANRKWRRNIRGVSPDAMSVLMTYSWPGNVRELENIIQRMLVVATRDIVELDDVPRELRGDTSACSANARDLRGVARASIELVERQTILDALSRTGGNVTHAAKALGVSRATLQNKMKAYGLRNPGKNP
jgi:DNA-binding NtrC family response regulator